MTCALPLNETLSALLRLVSKGVSLLQNPLNQRINGIFDLSIRINGCYIALFNDSGFMTSLTPPQAQIFNDSYNAFKEYLPPDAPIGTPPNFIDYFPAGMPTGFIPDLLAGHPNGITQWGLPVQYEQDFIDEVSIVPEESMNPAYIALLDILNIPHPKRPGGIPVWFTKRSYITCNLGDITPEIIADLASVGAPVNSSNFRSYFTNERLAALTNLSLFVPLNGFVSSQTAPTYSSVGPIDPNLPAILNGSFHTFKAATDALSGAKNPISGLTANPLDFNTAASNVNMGARVQETILTTANPERRINSVFGILTGKSNDMFDELENVMETLSRVLCLDPATALANIINGTLQNIIFTFNAIKDMIKSLLKDLTLANLANAALAYLLGRISLSLEFSIAATDGCQLFNDLMDELLTDQAKSVIDGLSEAIPAPPLPEPPFGLNRVLNFDL